MTTTSGAVSRTLSSVRRRRSRRSMLAPPRWFSVTVTTVVMAFSLVPMWWMFSTAFKRLEEVYASSPTWIPQDPNLDAFRYVIERADFLTYFRNSLIVAAATTVLTMTVAVLAGYALSWLRFPGRNRLLLVLVTTQMFPSVLLIIPLFHLMRTLDILDTLLPLVIANATFAVPLCVWLMKNTFDQVPREIAAAAMIDGCGPLGAVYRVVMPSALPGVMAAALFAFIAAWDEFVFAFTFTSSDDTRTLPVALSLLTSSYEVQWAHLAAMALLITLPVLVLFAIVERWIVTGVTSGAVNG